MQKTMLTKKVGMMKYILILLSFILAGIFSDEFILKTDSIYYNTLYGRSKATQVKLLLGFTFITVVYWLSVGIYSLTVLGSLGMDGADCMLQSHGAYWNSKANLTFKQLYLLTIGAGYLGYLFVGFFVIWISAKSKSPVLAVLVPSLVICIPMYLYEVYNLTIRYIIGILPDRLLDIWSAIEYQYLYSVGDHVMTAVPILMTVYPCITILLVVLCYREYRHKQVT